jgi:DNA polymerase
VIEVVVSSFEEWRAQARRAVSGGVAPGALRFLTPHGQPSLAAEPLPPPTGIPRPRVPKAFLELARTVAMHRDPSRWDLLYRVLYRMSNGEHGLLDFEVDPDVRALRRMEQAIRHEIHRVHAFVRFRKILDEAGERFIAWFEPEHDVLEAAAPFFARRFAAMHWWILTPRRSAHWDGERLEFGPGVPRSSAPAGDELEDLWRDYYASIFNPARLSLATMRSEMPVRYWHTMPETSLLPSLIHGAEGRVNDMQRNQPASAAPFVPAGAALPVLAEASKSCEGCDLYRFATQTVFGEGPPSARVVMVGEQPGDSEDLAGHPFVGPAGKLLDRALEEAEVDRRLVYVTNAVKHFKFEPRGKRRIHSKPTGIEINACRPWLEAELAAIQPDLVVCLGATAAQSLLGRAFRVTRERGVILPFPQGKQIMATIHPSALLRMPEPERREAEYAAFVEDLRQIRRIVA